MKLPIPAGPARRFLLLVVVLIAIGVTALVLGPPDQAWLASLADRAGSVGPVVAVAGYAVGVVVMVPRTMLSFVSGLLFGWMPGFVYAMLGALIGSSAGFAAGRLLGRDFVDSRLDAWSRLEGEEPETVRGRLSRWVRRRLAIADKWLERRGILGVWILRTIPVAHYGLTSYACGTAAVRYRHFLLGTLGGSIPGALGYTAVGSSLLDTASLPLTLGLAWALTLVSLGAVTLVRRRTEARAASAQGVGESA
ncbi:TVP38/TMEM64 family protein [Phytomonospora sp. NPDC050363]|uniref:TVP38/TMEM64 family protein n=1 Tax=Phytomonospora sp. NPDC050363 TaxID=3155642 RepID=UPI0033FF772B